ncbi:MAG: DM13 domain-containing protein [Aurantimicrobium sp.]|uniref:DM13 domain-containing protein n=1 Tax=Aurantimicrobium sp. TaxID=1930784 RepID=UPI00302D2960
MSFRQSKAAAIVAVVLSVMGLVVAGAFFQPWQLFNNTQVNEAFPTAIETSSSGNTSSQNPDSATSAHSEVISFPLVLGKGTFVSHEHPTAGTVTIFENSDGTRTLRIDDLNTTNGPQLEVWLTDAPVIDGVDGWGVFDDGNFVNLGALKGNIGSQNYEIPSDVNLDDFTSVSIWCARFFVSFGAAELIKQ